MKYFGFVKEHDNCKISNSITDLIIDDIPIHKKQKEVLEYLKKGVLAVPQMGCVDDAMNPLFGTDDYNDNSFIAYYACYTDGIWLWPQYIIEYIEKYPHIKLDANFVKHVIKNKDKKIIVSEKERSKIEEEYYKKIFK